MTDVYLFNEKVEANEGASFTMTARARSGDASTTPTTAKYRIDCLTSGQNIKGWTALTPTASMSISISPTDNALKDAGRDYEYRQVTVEVDTDLSSQNRDIAVYRLNNIQGF